MYNYYSYYSYGDQAEMERSKLLQTQLEADQPWAPEIYECCLFKEDKLMFIYTTCDCFLLFKHTGRTNETDKTTIYTILAAN